MLWTSQHHSALNSWIGPSCSLLPLGAELPSRQLPPRLPLQASRPAVTDLPAGCAQAAQPLLPIHSLILLPPLPLFPSFMAGIWKPFLFIHCTRMLPRAVLQRAESSESLQGRFGGCMQSSQLFAGSVWARYISVEAAWPSVHMGHPGLSASRMEAVRILSESGWLFCVLLFFIPSPFSVLQ